MKFNVELKTVRQGILIIGGFMQIFMTRRDDRQFSEHWQAN